MLTPAAKRRRIDAASHALSKPFRPPFKSPFKSPLKTPSSSANTTLGTPIPHATSTPAPLLSDKTPSLPAPSKSTTSNRTPRATKTYSSPISAAALNADPDIAPLLRAQRELEKQLKQAKEELEIVEQARKIEKESRQKDPEGEVDSELMELMERWKGASRLAAEELFGKVRDRVNRMGGPRAWREMQKKQQEFQNSWDQEQQKNEDENDEDLEGRDVEKRDLFAEYDVDLETENEKSQREKGLGDTGELPGQEDEFTLAMMLRTLNVDLDIIGYDKEHQRWKD